MEAKRVWKHFRGFSWEPLETAEAPLCVLMWCNNTVRLPVGSDASLGTNADVHSWCLNLSQMWPHLQVSSSGSSRGTSWWQQCYQPISAAPQIRSLLRQSDIKGKLLLLVCIVKEPHCIGVNSQVQIGNREMSFYVQIQMCWRSPNPMCAIMRPGFNQDLSPSSWIHAASPAEHSYGGRAGLMMEEGLWTTM